MNSKMTTNSQLSTTNLKKPKQSKQTTRTGTEPQKSHGDHMEGYQWGSGGMGVKIQGMSSTNGR